MTSSGDGMPKALVSLLVSDARTRCRASRKPGLFGYRCLVSVGERNAACLEASF
jgi:hypothetical protein